MSDPATYEARGRYEELKEAIEKKLQDYNRRLSTFGEPFKRAHPGLVAFDPGWMESMRAIIEEGRQLAELARQANLQAERCSRPRLDVTIINAPKLF